MGVLIIGVLGAVNYLVLNRFVVRIDLIDCVLISLLPFIPAMVPPVLANSGGLPISVAAVLMVLLLLGGSWVMYAWRATMTRTRALAFAFGQVALALLLGFLIQLFTERLGMFNAWQS